MALATAAHVFGDVFAQGRPERLVLRVGAELGCIACVRWVRRVPDSVPFAFGVSAASKSDISVV